MTRQIDLSGEWRMKEDSHHIDTMCRIPGDVITPLIEEGSLEQPYFGEQELLLQWIGSADFSISRDFTVTEQMLEADHIELHLRSVDTHAKVFIGDVEIFEMCNMFRSYAFDIKRFLVPGENSIEIRLLSSEKAAQELSAKLPYEIPHMVNPVQSMHRNLIRKVQCHSGWDWGPCIMVSGIYDEIAVVCWDDILLDAVLADTLREADSWYLSLRMKVYLGSSCRIPEQQVRVVAADLQIDETFDLPDRCCPEDIVYEEDGRRYVWCSCRYDARMPELWWPAGYGTQRLYAVQVSAGDVKKRISVGFREVRLIAENDRYGRSMTVEVNGKKIFCKGSNWIPVDALPSAQQAGRYLQLLEDAAEANMNMIRVWGGGQYEKDIFYETCDRLGLMVWQDCMFSCALYPATEEFLGEVRQEITSQVERLQHHPSIALWCGNNEDVGALMWFDVSLKNRDRYLVDYDRLNEGALGSVIRELDPHRPWWPSSPSGGPGDYSDCWHDDAVGDMHYWSVWHEGKPFEAYREVIPRFCSEFGFQSFPSYEEARGVISADQMNISSPQMLHHQKNVAGNAIIMQTMARYFRMPTSFEQVLYLSQVQQSYGIQMAIDYWRTNRPRCMGTLYWQLNDLWPVASWSSIEYSGRWKLLHHAAKRFFSPVHIAIVPTGDSIRVHGINDTDIEDRGLLIAEVYDMKGRLIEEDRREVSLPPEAAGELLSLSCADTALERDRFLRVTYKEQELIHLYTLPQRCELSEPRIEVTYEPEHHQWVLSSDVPAFYVWLETGCAGHFSDNGFFLLPGEQKRVSFHPIISRGSEAPEPSSAEAVRVYDLYHASRG